MLSLELCLKRKRIRSAVQFRSCLFSYASTGSWWSCDSLHTWSRAAGELCVHYFSAVQSHSSQARRDYWVSIDVSWIAAVTPRSYFEMWHYLRLLQRRWNVFEIKQIKIDQADVQTWKKPVIVVRAALSADPTHRQGVKWWQEEQRGEKLAQDQVHLTDFLAGCFILCDTPLCSKYVPVNQIILYLDEVFSRWAWLYQKLFKSRTKDTFGRFFQNNTLTSRNWSAAFIHP